MMSFLTLKKIFKMKLTSFTQSKVRTDLLNSSTANPYHGDFSPPPIPTIYPISTLQAPQRRTSHFPQRSFFVDSIYSLRVSGHCYGFIRLHTKSPLSFQKRARDCKVNVVYVWSKSKNNFYLNWRLFLSLQSLVCLRYYDEMVQVISLDDSWEALLVYSTLAFISSWTFHGI